MNESPKLALSEGQQILVRAARHLNDRWRQSTIRTGNLDDKFAADKLIWLVHNFDFERLEDEDFPCEPFEIPAGPITETDLHSRGEVIRSHHR